MSRSVLCGFKDHNVCGGALVGCDCSCHYTSADIQKFNAKAHPIFALISNLRAASMANKTEFSREDVHKYLVKMERDLWKVRPSRMWQDQLVSVIVEALKNPQMGYDKIAEKLEKREQKFRTDRTVVSRRNIGHGHYVYVFNRVNARNQIVRVSVDIDANRVEVVTNNGYPKVYALRSQRLSPLAAKCVAIALDAAVA